MMWVQNGNVLNHSSSMASPFKHPVPDRRFGAGLGEQCAAPLDGDSSLGLAPEKQGGEHKNPYGQTLP